MSVELDPGFAALGLTDVNDSDFVTATFVFFGGSLFALAETLFLCEDNVLALACFALLRAFVLLFVLTAIKFLDSLRHFFGDVLLKTFAHTLKWNALENRVEEAFHYNLFRFALRNAT